ncbi:Protein of uncharacterised function (DUF2786) [Bordetella ansorpii]|uniref:Protein of uncharacterized function (DUF2786) n=1 Tax=Bordetella ansorpii TaxID=288768 RepID=A0A157SW83_9BORD|nr:DUF2786 domain-containing protein [Bordetella ansorpii]SAI74601.1 Protein of uncharacterised function (DUF2786) [Bordetella ansorpii]
MDKDDIFRKIEKCLSLAKSSEPAEAAAAMRQAQALMREHSVSELEVTAASVREKIVMAGALKPSRYEADLASLVASAFGCELILVGAGALSGSRAMWLLVGCPPGVDVAQYTLHVLMRLMARARRDHIKTKLKRCRQKSKTVRADAFCLGWVDAVSTLISHMEATAHQKTAIEAHMQLKHPNLGNFTPRSRDAGVRGWADRAAGRRAGNDVQLHQGVGARAAPLMLGYGE